jgi:hypothetical protein
MTPFFYDQNRVHKEDFSKLSTAEFPVSNGPVEFLNRSGPAGLGPFPALQPVG